MFILCLLNWIQKLPLETKTTIHQSKILFSNGYAFDEFFPDVIAASIDYAIDAGTSIFLDPGPRGTSLLFLFTEQCSYVQCNGYLVVICLIAFLG